MESCAYGHPLTDENVYRHPSGHRRCKQCHADQARHTRAVERMQALPDRIATLQSELDALRQQYAADPKSARLSREYGEASQALVWAKKSAARAAQPKWVRPPKPPAPLDNSEWAALLPPHCPACGGWPSNSFGMKEPLPVAGYSVRVGDRGAQCLICHAQFELESS